MTRLFINWYLENKQPRGKELNRCVENNFRSKFIDEIINLSDTKLPEGKIKNIAIEGRPTYNDFLRVISEIAKPNDISIIANLDIYFDETILLCKNMTERDVYALTRWDVWDEKGKDVTFLNRHDSQDAWIFKGKPKLIPAANFGIGVPGCDNAFAFLLKKNGYRVSNPSLTIKAYHYHRDARRNYKNGNKQLVPSAPEPYLLISPSKLQIV